MQDSDDFFDAIYGLKTQEEVSEHYQIFADRYEKAMRDNGYVTPTRCATALKDAGITKNTAILDIGCGTGLSGEALRAAGYRLIDGTDFSPEMLEIASKKGIYRNLIRGDLRELPGNIEYKVVMAAGVLNPAHAPASVMDDILGIMEPDGIFVFSLNDNAIADGSYEGRLHELIDAGGVDLLAREYGEHLPGQDLKAWVLTLRKK